MGGKARAAKRIVDILPEADILVEPFCGGCNVTSVAAASGKWGKILASDSNESIVLMWQAFMDGWEPEPITEEQYKELRHAPPSALKGFAGSAGSFAGKWFGGIARTRPDRNYQEEGIRAARRQAAVMRNVEFQCLQYQDVQIPSGSVLYLDPPYVATTGYADDFNSDDFWKWADSLDVPAFVSEYEGDWEPVASWTRNVSVDRPKNVTERLYWNGI